MGEWVREIPETMELHHKIKHKLEGKKIMHQKNKQKKKPKSCLGDAHTKKSNYHADRKHAIEFLPLRKSSCFDTTGGLSN